MKSQGQSVQIHDKSVRKSRPTPPRLFRLRNGIFVRSLRQLLVRGGNRKTADADARRRLPVPGVFAQNRERSDAHNAVVKRHRVVGRATALNIVIAGLDPAIHPFQKMDTRVKPAYDGRF
jgi:hypothetical protein